MKAGERCMLAYRQLFWAQAGRVTQQISLSTSDHGPYRSLISVCAFPGLSWGIYFTAYNNAKMRWQGLRNEASLPAPLHLLSAAEAGCMVSA
jgi:hypothetical protein